VENLLCEVMKLSVSGGAFGIEVVSGVWYAGLKLISLIPRTAETMG
jgi:hypothetical protein